MKAKLVRTVLEQKFKKFAESIKNEELKEKVKKGTIITGGSITSLLLNEPVNDFDMYFRTQDLCLEVALYYVEQFKKNNPKILHKSNVDRTLAPEAVLEDGRVKIVIRSAGVVSETTEEPYQFFEGLDPEDPRRDRFIEDITAILKDTSTNKKGSGEYRPIFITSNAITLSDKIQLVIRFYGEPEDIHKNYDFVHCTNYWCSWNNELILSKEALEAILTKQLIYQGSLYPICSLIRMRKFVNKGWTCNAGQILKMCYQVNELNLKDMSVLKEQLMGVDVVYFMEMFEKMKDQDPKLIDSAYICKLVDEVF